MVKFVNYLTLRVTYVYIFYYTRVLFYPSYTLLIYIIFLENPDIAIGHSPRLQESFL